MTTQDVVKGYFQAWTRRDLPKARSFLADNLAFQGSIDRFQNADDFVRALGGFLQMLTDVRLVGEFYSDQDAMMLYDCVTPTPAGTIRTAEYFRVADGKIQQILLVFDATELRKMMGPAKAAAVQPA